MISIVKLITPSIIHPFLRKCWKLSLKFYFRIKEIFLFCELIFFKITGRNFFKWYSAKLDKWALNTTKFKDKKSKANKHFLISGKDDLDVLKKVGLKKNDYLLEYGCGWLRSSVHFIGYLKKGHYLGVDPAKNRIEKGIKFFEIERLNKNARFHLNKDNLFNFVKNEKFDFIWCNAVFGHIPESDIETMFKNVKKTMKKSSKFVFTYHDIVAHKNLKSLHKHFSFYDFFNFRKDIKRLNARDWFHSSEFYEKIGKNVGLKMTFHPKILTKYKSINKDFRLCIAKLI